MPGSRTIDGPEKSAVLIFHLRTARKRARIAAVEEVLWLLHDLGPEALAGGPLSDQGGVFWIALPPDSVETASSRFPRLGYTAAVDLLQPSTSGGQFPDRLTAAVRWRRRIYNLHRLYEEDEDAMRADAPDRRSFLFEGRDGVVRSVQGYRGDSEPLSRRGLPVADARLLVNLVYPGEGSILLDPFAGIGGILREAAASGCRALSLDCDPALRHGLAAIGCRHLVGDAALLPFPSDAVGAVATEPPYHPEAEATVLEALSEIARVLQPGGRAAMLCAAWQADGLRNRAQSLPLTVLLDTPINRKGLDVVLIVWRKKPCIG